DRVAGVPARGGDEYVAEGAVGEQPRVHHRVEGNAPAEAQADAAPAPDGGLPGEVERRLLDDGLEAEGDVLVELGDGFVGPARGAEALQEALRDPGIAVLGVPAGPAQVDAKLGVGTAAHHAAKII